MRTLDEIRTIGLEALTEALGPSDMIRFLQIYGGGSGDYTKERGERLEDGDVRELADTIIAARVLDSGP